MYDYSASFAFHKIIWEFACLVYTGHHLTTPPHVTLVTVLLELGL